MKVLVFGNPHLEGDSIAIKVAKEIELDDVEFVFCFHPDDVLNYSGDIVIMDVVKGIDKVQIIEDLDNIKFNSSVTMHDFDLGMILKLKKASGELNVRVIGIPEKNIDQELFKNLLIKLNS